MIRPSMRIAVMQPYLFPYLGYFQLVNAVDKFIFFDDVNYINKGWINRNQILQGNDILKFTVPLLKASQNKLINEIEIADFSKWRKSFLKSIEINYNRAPQFTELFSKLQLFLKTDFVKISDLAESSVRFVANLLEFDTVFDQSLAINYKTAGNMNGAQKILAICEILGANEYLNPKNGAALYDREVFSKKNISIDFLNMEKLNYQQFQNKSFVPDLSILDVLMFNSISETKELVLKYFLN